MKIMTLLLLAGSISIAQAEIYKCPGKKEGQYIYQASPCKGAKPNEHTLKTIPFDEQKAKEAQEKLAKDIKALEDEKAKENKPAGTAVQPPANTTPPSPVPPPPAPPNSDSGTIPNQGATNPNPIPAVPPAQTAPAQPAPNVTPVPAVTVPPADTTLPPSSQSTNPSSK